MDILVSISDFLLSLDAAKLIGAFSVLFNSALAAAFLSIHHSQNAAYKATQIAQEASYKAAQLAQEAVYKTAQFAQDAAYKTAQSKLDLSHQSVLKEQQSLLDAALHANKTSFSRIDEARSNAVIKLDSAVRSHFFLLCSFPLPALSVEPPRDLAIRWVIDLKHRATLVGEIQNEIGLLLPEKFCSVVGLHWVNAAVKLGADYGNAFFAASDKPGFDALTRSEQSDVLVAAHKKVGEVDNSSFYGLNRTVRLSLSQMFHGEPHQWGTPTTWPLNDEAAISDNGQSTGIRERI